MCVVPTMAAATLQVVVLSLSIRTTRDGVARIRREGETGGEASRREREREREELIAPAPSVSANAQKLLNRTARHRFLSTERSLLAAQNKQQIAH